MPVLTAGEILASIQRSRVIRKVAVPEWGEGAEVHVAAFDLTGREWYITRVLQLNEAKDAALSASFPALVLQRQMVNPDGSLMFDSAEAPVLGQMGAETANMLIRHILEASGLKAAAVDDAEKNSVTVPSSGLPSVSPSASE